MIVKFRCTNCNNRIKLDTEAPYSKMPDFIYRLFRCGKCEHILMVIAEQNRAVNPFASKSWLQVIRNSPHLNAELGRMERDKGLNRLIPVVKHKPEPKPLPDTIKSMEVTQSYHFGIPTSTEMKLDMRRKIG